MRLLLTSSILLLAATAATADAPLPPPALVTRCSVDKRHCATADPRADSLTVHEMSDGKRGKRLWSLKGWEREFELANGGEDLVVCYSGMNLLPVDYSPEWPMLKFYHRGELVRQVLLRDLILDVSKLKRTVSHYHWGQCMGFGSGGTFEVETVDRGLLRFSLRTGLLKEDR